MIPAKSLDWPDTAPERALTLPARYFYDEAIFKAERERIFYPAWHCVGHVNELAEPGQFLTFDILDQTIVVLRGDDGVIRALPQCLPASRQPPAGRAARQAGQRAALRLSLLVLRPRRPA